MILILFVCIVYNDKHASLRWKSSSYRKIALTLDGKLKLNITKKKHLEPWSVFYYDHHIFMGARTDSRHNNVNNILYIARHFHGRTYIQTRLRKIYTAELEKRGSVPSGPRPTSIFVHVLNIVVWNHYHILFH